MSGMLILQFFILTIVVTGAIIFFLHRFLVSSTDGAVKRLNTETETVRIKQSELNRKIKEVDEELARRKKEADELVKKMKTEAEESARAEREKMIKRAREEGEEIIAKAQRTRDQIRLEIQKEMELKTIDHCIEILNAVLTDKAKSVLDKQLISEFAENLEKINLDQVAVETDTADFITLTPLDEAAKGKFAKILKSKLNRDIKINSITDESIVGGIVLRFGSLALDGSLQNVLKDAATAIKQEVEEQ